MAINTDGQKKQGRFLKRNSKILSSCTMVDFNFEEICTHELVSFDNPDRSIIHARFHDPRKLNDIVKGHQTMNERVQDPSQPSLGVIFPADFTQDWHNERLNSKRRALGFDDEDEIDFAEVARNRGQVVTKTPTSAQSEVTAESPNADSPAALDSPTMVAHASPPEAVRAPEQDGKVLTLNEADMSSAINKAFTPPANKNPQSQAAAPKTAADDNSFTPLPTESGQDPISAEDKAIESWKGKQQLAKHNEQLLEELRSEARSEGFQSGFREGEEKGLLSGQKNAAQVFTKVGEILREFESLKGVILDNVQKNFYELSQAIGEALLGREFSIKPDAYATMIQRVIKDTVAPNEFKVRMNPETWQKVHDLGINELEPYLIKDQGITPGEFRVESSMSVVDVNAKKLVTQLLEKADIDLFDQKKAI
jgi:flagellar biosynthesis/type III secretory pathway protein FliH